jgi:hypothetical protein
MEFNAGRLSLLRTSLRAASFVIPSLCHLPNLLWGRQRLTNKDFPISLPSELAHEVSFTLQEQNL